MSRATQEAGAATAVAEKESYGIKKMSDAAWSILELKVTEPDLRQVDIGERLNITQAYISKVVNSDCFMAEMAKIRNARITAKLQRAGESGVDRLQRIVDAEDSSDGDAIRATELVLNASGYLKQGGVNVNVGMPMTAEGLGVTREMVMEAALRRQEKVISGESKVVADEDE